MPSEEKNTPGLMLSWRGLALASTLLCIASITGLVVVVATNDQDALSTIALVLAIIAFASQLLIFAWQSVLSGQQLTRTEEVNADMRALVAEIRTRTVGTQNVLEQQFDAVLKYALASDSRGAGDDVAGPGEPSAGPSIEALSEAVRHHLVASGSDMSEPGSRVASQHDLEIADQLGTFPDGESAGEALSILTKLSPMAVAKLRTYALNEMGKRRRGEAPGLAIYPGTAVVAEEMIDLDLLERTPRIAGSPADPSWDFARLTDQGREVARLVVARGELPEYLAEISRSASG